VAEISSGPVIKVGGGYGKTFLPSTGKLLILVEKTALSLARIFHHFFGGAPVCNRLWAGERTKPVANRRSNLSAF